MALSLGRSARYAVTDESHARGCRSSRPGGWRPLEAECSVTAAHPHVSATPRVGPSADDPDRQTPALCVRGVRKSFGSTAVLHGVDLTVQPGEFLTLLGPSGCGKTTLLRIIAGLDTPDAGSLSLDGADIAHLPASRRPVNTVFQSYALFPHLSVVDNVAFGLRSRRSPEAEVGRRVGEAMELLQIGELARRRPHELSGGQKQRVALARALVNEPAVLLLDEPMSALDAKLRSQVQVELRRLQQRLGKAFILVTHDQDEAMTVSDRIAVMNGGRIEQIGSPSVVYERPRTRFVADFMGAANLIEAHKNGHWNGPRPGLETPLGVLVVDDEPAWERGTLAIRPERVRLCDGPPAFNGLRMRVTDCVYRGDHRDVWLTGPGDVGLRMRTLPAMPVATDDEVWVELPPESLGVLVD
jgi:spermidine/putrescine transport system ATP-binding protein